MHLSLLRNALSALLLWCCAAVHAEQYTVPLFVPASPGGDPQGVLRLVNDAETAGTVSIHAIGDDGARIGPATLTLDALAAVELSAAELASGNAAKGLPSGLGSLSGDVRLSIESDVSVVPAAYVRATDGALSAMNATVLEASGAGPDAHGYDVTLFHAATDVIQPSRLRLINPGDAAARVTIAARDDAGMAATGGTVELTLPGGAARTLTARQLEAGDPAALTGRLGAGTGNWRLSVTSDRPIQAVNVTVGSGGDWSNLSTTAVTGWAPEDQASFEARFLDRVIVSRDGLDRLELRVLAGNRFRDTGLEDGVRTSEEGEYGFERTGRDSGLLTFMPDSGQPCAANFYFDSPISGWYASGCVDSADAVENWTGGAWRALDAGAAPLDLGSGLEDLAYAVGAEIDALTLPAASGGDGEFTYSLSPQVPGLTFDPATRELTGTPSEAGAWLMTYRVRDASGDSDWRYFNIAVEAATGGETSHEVGDTLSDLPTGNWTPSLSGDGSVRTSGGVVTAELDDGTYFEHAGHRYTCQNAGGCTIENRRITSGTVVQTASGTAPGGGVPGDPGDDRASAVEVAPESDTEADLTAGDVDYFRVVLDAPGTLEAYTSGRTDTLGRLEDADGAVLGRNDDGGAGTNFRISEDVSSGTYFVRVAGYSSRVTGDYTLHVRFAGSESGTTPPGTGAVERLTDHDAGGIFPSWSPDGQRIAFHSNRDGKLEVYVMDADGANLRRLTDHDASDGFPSWSPDGRRIVFDSNRDGNWEVYVMDADGGNLRRLTDHDADDFWSSWSPDGQRIAFSSDRDGNFEVYVMDADGANLRRLTDHDAGAFLPSWSPDGQRIAFHSNRDGNFEVYVMDADGGNLRRLTDHDASDGFPSWSPDGRRIAFGSNRDGNWEVYAMDADGDGTGQDPLPSFAAGSGPDDLTFTAGMAVSALTLPAAGGGDGPRTYSLSPAVPGLIFNATANVRELTGTPTVAGTYDMTYTVRDVNGNTDSLTFTVTVQDTADSGQVGSFDLHRDHFNSRGIAYANDRLYVFNWLSNKVYAYTVTGQRDPDNDFDVFNVGPLDRFAYANGRFYVFNVQGVGGKLFAYTETGQRDASNDIELHDSNIWPRGIAYAGGRYYVVDVRGGHVYAYTTSGDRDLTADFDLNRDNSAPIGIANANGRFYVVDDFDDKVYAYTVSGQRDAAADFALACDNLSAIGITYANGEFHVLDWLDSKIYTYAGAGESTGLFPCFPTGSGSGDQTYTVGTAISELALPTARGGDGPLTYSLSPQVPGLSFNATTRRLTGTPSSAGTFDMTYQVRDTDGGTDSLTFTITVIAPDTAPDLVVGSASVSDSSPNTGASFTLSATVRNQGGGESGSTTLRYYRSTNSTISTTDTQEGTDPVGRLAASGTSAESIRLTAPSSAGTYYYGACVDSVTGESDTSNNCSSAVSVTVSGGDPGGGGDGSCVEVNDVVELGEGQSCTITQALVNKYSLNSFSVRAGDTASCSGGRTRLGLFNSSGSIHLNGLTIRCR